MPILVHLKIHFISLILRNQRVLSSNYLKISLRYFNSLNQHYTKNTQLCILFKKLKITHFGRGDRLHLSLVLVTFAMVKCQLPNVSSNYIGRAGLSAHPIYIQPYNKAAFPQSLICVIISTVNFSSLQCLGISITSSRKESDFILTVTIFVSQVNKSQQ